MKVLFNRVLLTLDGIPLQEPYGEEKTEKKNYPCGKCGSFVEVEIRDRDKRALTLKSVATSALMGAYDMQEGN